MTDPANVRALAAAVIVQAWQDMVAPGTSHDRRLIHAEAIQFLTAPTGRYAESRVEWCDSAEIHPGKLRCAAMDALALMAIGGKPIFKASDVAPRDRPTDEDGTEEEFA